MKHFIVAILLLVCAVAHGANPSFNDVLVRTNNLSDITDKRKATTNEGYAVTSPLGGNAPIADLSNFKPAFEGQLLVGFAGGGGKQGDIAMAGSTSSNDLKSVAFSVGIAQIGSETNMDVNLTGDVFWNFVGNRANYGQTGDHILVTRSWATNDSGSGFGISIMGVNPATGLPIVISPIGVTWQVPPTNALYSLSRGWNLLTANSPLHGTMIATPAASGFDSGNYAYILADNDNKLFRVPKWVAGAYDPTTNTYRDAFTVSPASGLVRSYLSNQVDGTLFLPSGSGTLIHLAGQINIKAVGADGGSLTLEDSANSEFMAISKNRGIYFETAGNVQTLQWGQTGGLITNTASGVFRVLDSSAGLGTINASVNASQLLLTNAPTLRSTNTAPANVTVGVTAPDTWYVVTNNAGVRMKIPGWIEH